MNIERLRNLSSARLLNMKAALKRGGLKSVTIASRMTRPDSSLRVEEAQAIENGIIDLITDAVTIAGIDRVKLANALQLSLSKEYYSGDGSVDPYGYIAKAGARPIPVYDKEDRYRKRIQREDSAEPLFYTHSQIRALVNDQFFRASPRGKELLSSVE